MATYLADRVIVFEGTPSISTVANRSVLLLPFCLDHDNLYQTQLKVMLCWVSYASVGGAPEAYGSCRVCVPVFPRFYAMAEK